MLVIVNFASIITVFSYVRISQSLDDQNFEQIVFEPLLRILCDLPHQFIYFSPFFGSACVVLIYIILLAIPVINILKNGWTREGIVLHISSILSLVFSALIFLMYNHTFRVMASV